MLKKQKLLYTKSKKLSQKKNMRITYVFPNGVFSHVYDRDFPQLPHILLGFRSGKGITYIKAVIEVEEGKHVSISLTS